MTASRSVTRRLAAVASVIAMAAGLAAAAAESAQAAVPDQWGFAYVGKPTVPGIPDLTHQAGSWPAAFKVHTTPGAVGRVFVTFPRIASKGGVVHVTAVNAGPVWCQAEKWAPSGLNEVVVVRCHKAGGAPVFSPFTVLYTTSTKGPFPAGRAYGYVHFEPAGGIVASFNSVGAVNTVTPSGVGVWVVRMPGLGSSTPAGNVQVTAVNPSGPAKCEIAGWSGNAGGQKFAVACFNGGATPLKTGWTLSYQRGRSIFGGQPKLFAYTYNNKPSIPGPYAPGPPPVNFNSLAGVNTIQRAGTGLSLVQFPRVGVLPNTVLVSPFKVGPGFCNLLTLWATSPASAQVTVRDVACYNAAGAQTTSQSFITYTSSH
ncbi:MAG TPA: hypothetical protein VEV63_02565 [Streptosporangiaceae bacterium]|nr:hypothetical protein [Streptosporangiaceae bacterium]